MHSLHSTFCRLLKGGDVVCFHFSKDFFTPCVHVTILCELFIDVYCSKIFIFTMFSQSIIHRDNDPFIVYKQKIMLGNVFIKNFLPIRDFIYMHVYVCVYIIFYVVYVKFLLERNSIQYSTSTALDNFCNIFHQYKSTLTSNLFVLVVH